MKKGLIVSSMEIRSGETIFVVTLSTLGLLAVAFGAFSRKSKHEIGKRDRWTCVECGREFQDGWMVHGAHNSDKHHKGPHYDKPSSGAIRCVDCHQEQHENGTTLGASGDAYATNLLRATDRRTKKYRKSQKR
jgi:hypothetical protein